LLAEQCDRAAGDVCVMYQHVTDDHDSAAANSSVLSHDSEVSQLSSNGYYTPLCHKFVYMPAYQCVCYC